MAKNSNFHEDLTRNETVRAGSARSFGIVFTIVFAVIGLWPVVSGKEARVWSLVASSIFLSLSVFYPRVLTPLNALWFRFGMILHKAINPLIMGLLFYGTITPIAVIFRLMRKDPLRLKFDRTVSSYWIERVPPGPEPDTMRRQF